MVSGAWLHINGKANIEARNAKQYQTTKTPSKRLGQKKHNLFNFHRDVGLEYLRLIYFNYSSCLGCSLKAVRFCGLNANRVM